MKATSYLFILMMAVLLSFAAFNKSAAQIIVLPEITIEEEYYPLSVITVNEYPSLMHLRGLQKYTNLTYHGVPIDLRESNNYRLEGENEKVFVRAIYRDDGSLRNARLITKDTRLPLSVHQYLVSEPYQGWIMTGNRMIVRNFDEASTQYEVTMQNGDELRTLYFDAAGNPIRRLAVR